jgi:hypothetical protein
MRQFTWRVANVAGSKQPLTTEGRLSLLLGGQSSVNDSGLRLWWLQASVLAVSIVVIIINEVVGVEI